MKFKLDEVNLYLLPLILHNFELKMLNIPIGGRAKVSPV